MSILEHSNVNGRARAEIALGPGQVIDSVSWGMLTHNRIPGVASVNRGQLDDRVELTYEVSGERLSQWMELPRRRDEVLRLLERLCRSLLDARRFMLDASAFVLEPDDVFVDAASEEVCLVCLPIVDGQRWDPTTFFKRIVFNLRFDPRDDASYVSELIGVLGTDESLDLDRLAKMLRTLRLTDVAPVGASVRAGSPPIGGAGAPVTQEPALTEPVRQGRPERAGVAQPSATPTGFSVPGSGGTAPAHAAGRRVQTTSAAAGGDEDEKLMSWMYLLQHYSAANKAIYDGQKEQREARRARRAQDKAAATTPSGGAEQPAGSAAHGGAPASTVPSGAVPVTTEPAQIPPGDTFGYTVDVESLRAARARLSDAAVPAAPAQSASAAPGAAYSGLPGPPVPGTPVPGAPVAAASNPPAPAPPGPPVPAPPATGTSSAALTAWQGVLHIVSTGEVVYVTKSVFVVGRRRSRVDFAIPGDTVSKRHAIIHRDDDGFSIIDNGSTNGVRLNGEIIEPMTKARLFPGVEIRLGEEVLRFDVRSAL